MNTGGGWDCIVRICAALVSVRSRSSGCPGTLTYSESFIVRAGWSGGMLSAWKLCQSSSISGPSATRNPRSVNTSTSSRSMMLSGWSEPEPQPPPGERQVYPVRLEPQGLLDVTQCLAALLKRLGEGGTDVVGRLAGASTVVL